MNCRKDVLLICMAVLGVAALLDEKLSQYNQILSNMPHLKSKCLAFFMQWISDILQKCHKLNSSISTWGGPYTLGPKHTLTPSLL